MKIEAAIFDMDGLLINSEPFWQEAEQKVFSKLGVNLSTAMCESTMGFRVDEVIAHWYNLFPWPNPDFKETQNDIIIEVENLIHERGVALDGVYEILSFLKSLSIHIGLASSSHLRLIKVVLKKLEIQNYFEVIHSAEFEDYGKPHPAVYISAAKKLKVTCENCLAFEDSVNGTIAAKAAKMKVIAVPDPLLRNDKRFNIADLQLTSLIEFNKEILGRLSR